MAKPPLFPGKRGLALVRPPSGGMWKETDLHAVLHSTFRTWQLSQAGVACVLPLAFVPGGEILSTDSITDKRTKMDQRAIPHSVSALQDCDTIAVHPL